MIYARSQLDVLLSRLREVPTALIGIVGPRQTGKTTLINLALNQIERPYRYVALDDFDTVEKQFGKDGATRHPSDRPDPQSLIDIWHRARHSADETPRGFLLVLDEIHEVPEWSSVVKGLWDRDRREQRNLHVILCGSIPLTLHSKLKESLMGRFELIHTRHWSFKEMEEAFGYTLDEYIYFGGYPGAASLRNDKEKWRTYVNDAIISPNIEKDILRLNNVQKPDLLHEAFKLGSKQSGQLISLAKATRNLSEKGSVATINQHFYLLRRAELLARLDQYSSSPLFVATSVVKINVFNTALMTAMSVHSFQEAQRKTTYWQRLCKSAVCAHLLNSAIPMLRIGYWQDGPFEVDFILRRGSRVVAVEVESNRKVQSFVGLKEFRFRFAPERTIAVGQGGISLREFLKTPVESWFERD